MNDKPNDMAAVIEAARVQPPTTVTPDGKIYVVAPPGFMAHKLYQPPLEPLPTRIVAAQTFKDGDSLSRYVVRYKDTGSLLLADIGKSLVKVTLDYPDDEGDAPVGGEERFYAREHTASWPVGFSEEFRVWNAFQGRLHDQAVFLEFIEENVSEVLLPDSAKMLELVKDFSAVKEVQFQSSKRMDNGDRQLLYAEKTGTKSGITIPQQLTLRMPIYYGEEAVDFQAWFRWRIDEGQLKLGVAFHRIEPVKQAAFKVAVARVAEATGLDAFYGEA